MGIRIPRRKVVGGASVAFLLAAGLLLTWRGGLSPSSSSRQDALEDTRSDAGVLGTTDRAFTRWPVDESPRASTAATRTARGSVARSAGSSAAAADQDVPGGFSSFSGLSAGPASARDGDRHLDASAPAGLPGSLSAEERARLLPDKNATEIGPAPAPRRDRPGVRVHIPDDDHCVPRPPPHF